MQLLRERAIDKDATKVQEYNFRSINAINLYDIKAL